MVARHRYTYEGFVALIHIAVLLAASDFDAVRELLAHSLTGLVLTDDAVRAGLASYWTGVWASWKTADGHLYSTFDTFMLVVRGLHSLLEEDTDASRDMLREWLPPPAELLRIAEYECAWRAHAFGATHPALLCARLHGERLGGWEVATEVAEGLLAIEAFHPLLRTETLRLLSRAKAEVGDRVSACEAAERAAAQAAGAGYAWLEMRSLDDTLRWCGEAEVEDVRSRLHSVVRRLAATEEELEGVVGEGVL